ncbi:MAG: amidohydrolase family protein [Deltaproteobacteria bacterium]|nr:amidohydrolase family protein [Deltaproteobacteria bacterium]
MVLLAITHARLWTGEGPAREDMDILVSGDRVVAIGQGLDTTGAEVIDARGATVIPGLVDSHAHLSMSPGAAYRPGEPPAYAEHLRAYLACGVTTVLDPAVGPAASEAIAREPVGPRYLHLGMPFSPEGGYPAVLFDGAFPMVDTAAEAEAQLDAVVAQGAIGIKMTAERGFLGPTWPMFESEVARAIREGAARRELSVYVHAMSPAEQQLAIEEYGARATVHPLERPHSKVATLAAERGVYEVTTLSVLDMMGDAWDRSRLDDPFLDARVPAAELATARSLDVSRQFRIRFAQVVLPGLPALFATSGAARAIAAAHLRRTGRALRQLHGAGVVLVMGSDAGNWPIIPYLFHGPSSLRELELIVDAGFSPEQALTMATRNAGRMLDRDVGTLHEGGPADLLVVDGNPLDDIRALRRLRHVVRAGEARTPAGWLSPPAPPPGSTGASR